jgi:hypothetical protein
MEMMIENPVMTPAAAVQLKTSLAERVVKWRYELARVRERSLAAMRRGDFREQGRLTTRIAELNRMINQYQTVGGGE